MTTAKRAHGFEIHTCDDPDCGPHIVATNRDGKPICEMVLSPAVALEFIQELQGLLYEKATERGA